MAARRIIRLPKKPCANCEVWCEHARSGLSGLGALCKRCPGRAALIPPSRRPPRHFRLRP